MAEMASHVSTETIDSIVVRLAGDSGDGMQLVGDQLTGASANMGNYLCTLPDYPSEIRAPAGTVFGVSGFQLSIGGTEVFTPGDYYDLLVAMNPAALKVNLGGMRKGGIILVNEDAFVAKNIEKAGYTANPLETGELKEFDVVKVSMTVQTAQALQGMALGTKQADRCKNFFALGICFWLLNRTQTYTNKWLERKFGAKPEILEANKRAMQAGWSWAAESGAFKRNFSIPVTQKKTPGVYRNVTGNQAAALGLVAAAQQAGVKLFLGSYPITPATDIMHELVKYKEFATVFQAEDEIAGIGSALGAAFGGALAATTTSGPGFSLKAEFMNLAVMTELPLVIVDVQRAGPSTGLPTKTEQSDLLQAMWGRHGESPLVVMAATSPRDCFDIMIEASRIAVKYMTPVIVLSEGYLGNGSEVWRVPSVEELPKIDVKFRTNPEGFLPYERDPETLARPWAVPGTPGLEHRLGGLEKEDKTGLVSHSPQNHEKMTHLRAEKVARVARDIPKTQVYGDAGADTLVLGWGATAGAIKNAVRKLNREGVKVACAQLRYLNPLPSDLGELLKKYKRVLVPELNTGQLAFLLRATYLRELEQFNKVQGLPFRSEEIENRIRTMVGQERRV